MSSFSLHESDSFDSIPDVGFINEMIHSHSKQIIGPVSLVSEFKTKELNGELLPEPLLQEDKTRFVLFPIKHTDVSLLNFFEFLNLP
jgi:hypothetical protein